MDQNNSSFRDKLLAPWPNCGACPGDGSTCPNTCRLAEESPQPAAERAQGGLTEAQQQNLELVVARLGQIINGMSNPRELAVDALVCANAILARQPAPTRTPISKEWCLRMAAAEIESDVNIEVGAAPQEQAAPKDTPESMAASNARHAIDGAIQFGRENRNPPPSPDHWLYEYWNIGRQLAKLGETGWDNVTPLGGYVPVDEVKQLCRDFSSRTGSVYIGDVESSLDGLAEQYSVPAAPVAAERDCRECEGAGCYGDPNDSANSIQCAYCHGTGKESK